MYMGFIEPVEANLTTHLIPKSYCRSKISCHEGINHEFLGIYHFANPCPLSVFFQRQYTEKIRIKFEMD